MAAFLNLNLIIVLKCVDYGETCEFKFTIADYFNLEGDFWVNVQNKQYLVLVVTWKFFVI